MKWKCKNFLDSLTQRTSKEVKQTEEKEKKKEKETESTKTFFCTSNAQFKSTQLFPFHTYKQTEP